MGNASLSATRAGRSSSRCIASQDTKGQLVKSKFNGIFYIIYINYYIYKYIQHRKVENTNIEKDTLPKKRKQKVSDKTSYPEDSGMVNNRKEKPAAKEGKLCYVKSLFKNMAIFCM